MRELRSYQGVMVYQDEEGDTLADMPNPKHGEPKPKRLHFIADMSVDVDGHPSSYRMDNRQPPALDDVRASAGWPAGEWWNVLVRNPNDKTRPYVDAAGFCVSMTSYRRPGFDAIDRRSWIDPSVVAYSVIPGHIREICKGVLLGCRGRMTRTTDKLKVDTICADFSGGNIGECGLKAARTYGEQWAADNGDERKIYLYEFFPDEPALFDDPLTGEPFPLIPFGK